MKLFKNLKSRIKNVNNHRNRMKKINGKKQFTEEEAGYIAQKLNIDFSK